MNATVMTRQPATAAGTRSSLAAARARLLEDAAGELSTVLAAVLQRATDLGALALEDIPADASQYLAEVYLREIGRLRHVVAGILAHPGVTAALTPAEQAYWHERAGGTLAAAVGDGK